jgi:serine protease inhibitor
MIDMNTEDDLSWLIGMRTVDEQGNPWRISQAKQQTKLRLNEKGARAQSAAAIGCGTLSMPPPPFIVDRPFVFWVMRAGIDLPLFVSYITPEHWKEPADLSTP